MIKLIFFISLILSSNSFAQILQVNPEDLSFKYVESKSLGIHDGYNIQLYVGNNLVYMRPYFNLATLEQAKAFVDKNALTTIGLAKQDGKKIKLDISGVKALSGGRKDSPENAFATLFNISNQSSEAKYCDDSVAKRIDFILAKKSSDASKLDEIRLLVRPASKQSEASGSKQVQ